MNIFVVDVNPKKAANYLCDKHVNKMLIESCQMLSTAHRVLDGNEYTEMSKGKIPRKIKRYKLDDKKTEKTLYKASFINHPCSVWCRETSSNYKWLAIHALELSSEYTRRYKKIHSCENLAVFLHNRTPKNIKNSCLTPFAQAMPDQYKNPNAVEAYRQYYINEKKNFATWKTQAPYWWNVGEVNDCLSETAMA